MKLFFATLSVLFLVSTAFAQTRLVADTPEERNIKTIYHYAFDNEKFTTPHLELEFNEQGKGFFKFKKKDNDEMTNDLSVTTTVLNQINTLLTELNYFESSENYQYKKDFSHLGTITLDLAKSGKHRKVNFNYTENPIMHQLATIFRNLATQETRVFELEAIRQNDPLSTPAQLRFLESEIKSKNIADPERFTPILQDIRQDESLPLIARNHAKRLLDQIQKSK